MLLQKLNSVFFNFFKGVVDQESIRMEEEPTYDGYIYKWIFNYKILDPQGREIIVLEKVKITEEVEGNSSVISMKLPGRRRRRPGIKYKNIFESEEEALEYFINYFEDRFGTYLQNIKKLLIYFKNSDRIRFDRIYINNDVLILSKINTSRTLFIENKRIKTTVGFICTTTSFDINFSFNYSHIEKLKKHKKLFNYLNNDYFYYELDRNDPIRFYKKKWKEIVDKTNELYQQSTVKTLIRRTLV
jgi:hypothetical protein